MIDVTQLGPNGDPEYEIGKNGEYVANLTHQEAIELYVALGNALDFKPSQQMNPAPNYRQKET
jgi:hypothetical protein